MNSPFAPIRRWFLALAVLFGMMIPLSADQFGDFTYTSSGSAITITGYTGAGGAVSIPATISSLPVTSIGNYAFQNKATITAVAIPNGVASIGSSAFSSCTGLTSVTLPADVTTIGSQAFYSCDGLTSVTIPASVTSIGSYAFYRCNGLTAITVDVANASYSSLDGVLFNKALTTLIQCPGGKAGAYTVPTGVTSIASLAFSYCTGLTSVTVAASVTSIGSNTFGSCAGLTAITVDAANASFSSLAGVLFDKAQTTLIQYPGGKAGAYTIPVSVTTIASEAFNFCGGLTSVTLPVGVTSIDYRTFYSCTGLTNFTFSASVVSIGIQAFYNCTALTNVTIPASVSSIGNNAFSYCSALKSAFFSGNSPAMGTSVFSGTAAGFTVYYLTGKSGFTTPTWKGYPSEMRTGGTWILNGSGLWSAGANWLGGIVGSGSSATADFGLIDITADRTVSLDTPRDINRLVFGDTSPATAGGWILDNNGNPANVLALDGTTPTITVNELGTGKAVTIGAVLAGSARLTKSGTGMLTLSGSNTFTGGATVGAGTLRVGSGALPATTALTLSGGVLDLNGVSVTIRTLTVTGMDAVIDFGGLSSSNTLRFSNGATAGWTGNLVIRNFNPAADTLYFGTKATGVNGNLSKIKLVNPAGYPAGSYEVLIDSTGKICLAPFATTAPATNIRATEATLNGTVIPGGIATTVKFEYGPTSAYGNTKTVYISPNNGHTLLTVTSALGALVPATTYHYRLSATNSRGTALGADQVFTTYNLEPFTYWDDPLAGRTITGYTGPGGIVTIPATIYGQDVRGIGWGAFYTNKTITSVTIPSSVSEIPDYAFADCTNLTNVIIPSSVTRIGVCAFSNCAGLTSLSIPSSVTSIGGYAFSGCTGLTSVNIPSGVTSVGVYTFSGCTGLTSLTIPNNIACLEEGSFFRCASLTSVTIPASVTSIGIYAFGSCLKLTTIIVDSGNSEYSTLDGVLFDQGKTTLVQYPGGKTGTYTIPAGVMSIGSGAFEGCPGLTSLTIPASVTDIGISAFADCSGLASVTLPTSVTSIGDFAFDGCAGLLSVTIPASVTSIGRGAFAGCAKLTGLTLPSGITEIGSFVFDGCTALTGIIIPAGVTGIADHAFVGCTGLTSVALPAGVTGIGDYAFFGCTDLTSINLPAGVTSIGRGAFSGCIGLTGVILPEGVTSVAESLFEGCSGLTSVSIPTGVTSIGPFAFTGCAELAGIALPASLTSIGDSAFEACLRLDGVVIPAGIATIGNSLFYGCAGLTDIAIPNSVTRIGNHAFTGCTGLTAMTVPAGVTSIGNSAFSGCTGLTDLTLPDGVTSIGSSAFAGCIGLTGLVIPGGLSALGESVFYGCTGLLTITIPANVTSIGASAFSGCTGLTSVTLSPGVASIGVSAFADCTGLTSITLPASVTSIGSSAFSGCTGLKTIFVANSVDGFSKFAFAGCRALICVGGPGNLTCVGYYPFSGTAGLTAVTIPDGVTAIGSEAFVNCVDLLSVTIPASVTSIGRGAFAGCAKLTGLTLPPGITEIASFVFDGCTALTGIIIPAGVTGIADHAFVGCTGLTSVALPAGVTGIGDYAFFGCTDLTSINLPAGVASIGRSAFSGCIGLTGVTLPEGVTTVAESLFEGCSGLTSVSIPTGVTNIGAFAFVGCSGLTGVTLPASLTSIGDSAFEACLRLDGVVIPAGIGTIGNSLFYGCTGLTDIAIPNSVTRIGNHAFAGCTGLSAMTVPAGVTSIGTNAFLGCASLGAITVDGANPNYSGLDGVLFNKARSLLIQYPGGKAGSYAIPSGVTGVGSYAFEGCAVLNGVILPASVTSIDSGAFYSCTALQAAGFLGDAPSFMDFAVFAETAPGFMVYYLTGKTGFTSPLWQGYPAVAVGDPTVIVQPAVAGSIPGGTTTTLAVTALGSGTLGYQWYLGETGYVFDPVAGATSASFATPALTATTRYWVRVSNGSGFVDSETAVVTVDQPLDSNPNLAALAPDFGTLSPAFDPAVIAYQLSLPHEATEITLTPTAAAAGATVTVNGLPVASGAASAPLTLTVGSTVATVVVTAADGFASKTYTVGIHRAAALVVATDPAEVAGSTAAWLRGSLTPHGVATAYFEYGPTAAYGARTAAAEFAGGETLAMRVLLEGLAGNATYHYRAVAVGAAGPVVGEDVAFTTAAEAPLAVTGQPTATGGATATLAGAADPRGQAATVSFEYGLSTAYGRTTPPQSLPAGAGLADVSAAVADLIPNVNYHCRIVAANAAGTSYGDDVVFLASAGGGAGTGTPFAVPTAATGGTAGLAAASALLLGEATPNGGATLAHFEFGPTTAYGRATAPQGAGNGESPIAIALPAEGLLPGTLYHYRLVASNSLGTATGADRTFTTRFPAPAAVTGGAETLTSTRARVSGTVRASGADTEVWFDYGTDGITFPLSVRAVPATVGGDDTTAVAAELGGLSQGVTYAYRVRATSSGGTATGATATFAAALLSGLIQEFPAAVPLAERQGALTVNLSPAGPAHGWRLAGEQTWRASGTSAGGLVSGDRVVEYRPVPGLAQPPSETVAILSGGAPLALDRAYVPATEPATGRLTVTLKPKHLAEAVADGERLQWRLAGDAAAPWLDSGSTLEALAPGNHLVECREVPGRVAPELLTAPIANGRTTALVITYQRPPALVGAPPAVLDYATVAGSQDRPFAYVGQLRNEKGSGSGFVVRPGVVATAAHVVFDDGTLTLAGGLEWLFQRDRGAHEPDPQRPRGLYLMTGYAAQRALDNSPGTASAQSQALDAAALYFLSDPGRGGFSGYLASDSLENEFLLSPAPKTLVGFPVAGVPAADRDRMHATAPAAAAFAPAFGQTYTTSDIQGFGGTSGGPLCVRFENGGFYPAAIYLGGSAQAVVRAIDGSVADLIGFAETSATTGQLGTGGSLTQAGTTPVPSPNGSLQVLIEPAAARTGGAGWRLRAQTPYQAGGSREDDLAPNTYAVEFATVAGFVPPARPQVAVSAGQLTTVTFTYEKLIVPPAITSPDSATGPRGQPLAYQITALNDPDSFQLQGTLPDGITFDPAAGRISGTPAAAGNFVVTVGATNRSGSSNRTVAIAVLPLIADQTQTAPVNRPFAYQLASSESGTGLTFTAANLPAGLALDPVTGLIAGTPTAAGTHAVPVSVTIRSATAEAMLTLHITDTAPAIATQPAAALTVTYGATALLSVAATGSPAPTFQWFEGDAGDTSRPLEGATSATLTTRPLTAATRFWARASNLSGSADSATAVLTVLPSANPNLAALLPDAGSLSPAFNPDTAAYTLTLPHGVTALTLTPQAEVPQTTVTINGNPAALDTASAPIPLAAGDTPITVIATAGDGATARTHTLTVTRAAQAALATLEAIAVTDATATLTGSLTPNGPVTAFFEYGRTATYGDATPPQDFTGGTPLAVSAPLAGLAGNTGYHYRLVVTTPYGTLAGADREFATSPDQAAVATGAAVGVGTATAKLVGAVATNGLPTTVYFQFGDTAAYGTATPAQPVPAGAGMTDVFQDLTGLTAGATYHYRFVATNAAGTVYGEDVTFIAVIGGGGAGTGTPVAPPTAATGAATDLTPTAAILQGTANPQLGATLVRFDYGLTDAYGSATTSRGIGSGDQPVNVAIPLAGLQPGRLYHFRLVAENSGGTATGADATFTTGSLPPEVATGPAEPLSPASAKVTATVRARGQAVAVVFDYGTDGTTFPFSAAAEPATVAGTADTPVAATLGNLDAQTTYYYRVRAVAPAGDVPGSILALRTSALIGLKQQPATELAATERQGRITVSLMPETVAGTAWRFLGETAWRASGTTVTGLATGERELEYRPAADHIQPERETVSVISGGAPVVLERFYYRSARTGTAAIRVTLLPASLSAARWRLAGEPDSAWRPSATLLEGLMEGTYLVEAKPLAGWETPIPATLTVAPGETRALSLTYPAATAPMLNPPKPVAFDTVTGSTQLPYRLVGQLRSPTGHHSGFAVKQRVVATTAQAVFDEATLTLVPDLQWLPQRDSAAYEPEPLTPRGCYVFDGYAAQRAAEATPGTLAIESLNLNVAALHFGGDAARGGYTGFLASDDAQNPYLRGTHLKVLAGYPAAGVSADKLGRMHATTPSTSRLTLAHGRTFTSSGLGAIRGFSGMAGGPLCVKAGGSKYLPAGIYVGGVNSGTVRAIDGEVVDLFTRAEVSATGGEHHTGGGITHASFTVVAAATEPGSLQVVIEPAAARSAGAAWRLAPETSYRLSGARKGSLAAASYLLQLRPATGFRPPTETSVTIPGGELLAITYTYQADTPPPLITGAAAATAVRGYPLVYQIQATGAPTAYTLTGTLPLGLVFNPLTGLISGTPDQAGVFPVTVGASNDGGTTTRAITLTARPALPDQRATAPLGQPMTYPIASSETGAGTTYDALGLPPGLVLDPATGLITGTPDLPGESICSISVTKDGANSAALLTLAVVPSPQQAWRLLHFGTTDPAGPAADDADPDRDGQPNLAEYTAGTGPNDPTDFFHVLTATRAGATFTLTAAGKEGRTYVLERRTDTGTWTDAATTPAPLPADAPVTLTDPAAPAAQGIYRLRVTLP